MYFFRTVACGILAAAFSYPQAPKAPAPSKSQIREIRAIGCVRKAQNGCLILKTLDGKNTYTFVVAPKPFEGTVVEIQGNSHKGASACKQGIPIDVTDWQPTDETCVE